MRPFSPKLPGAIQLIEMYNDRQKKIDENMAKMDERIQKWKDVRLSLLQIH